MPGQVVFVSKRRVDIHPRTVDFSGQVLPGETIIDGEVFISVFSGEDPTPEDMLEGTLTISGTKLSHLIKQGIPGVVYQLVFRAITSGGDTLEIEGRQAVLEDAMPSGPIYQQYYFTTPPYPIDVVESLTSSFEVERGTFMGMGIEGTLSSFAPQSGTLRDILRSYQGKPEGILSAFEPQSGTLRDILISYQGKPEGIVSAIEPRSGTLKDTLISYTKAKPEGILSAFSVQAGSLT